MTMTRSISEGTGKTALVVRGGWEGHSPIETSDRYADALKQAGYEVTVSASLNCYLDAELLRGTDLIIQCWAMGTITAEQLAGLSAAIRVGTGFAGWHGGIIDAFRAEPAYHLITGGQFLHHPKGFVGYEVRPVPGNAHPITAGVGSFAVQTEQYYVQTDPSIDVLAVTDFVDDPDLPGAAGTTVPVTWTKRWGAGRVFVTTLGHELKDLEVPQTDEIIIRGLTWATR